MYATCGRPSVRHVAPCEERAASLVHLTQRKQLWRRAKQRVRLPMLRRLRPRQKNLPRGGVVAAIATSRPVQILWTSTRTTRRLRRLGGATTSTTSSSKSVPHWDRAVPAVGAPVWAQEGMLAEIQASKRLRVLKRPKRLKTRALPTRRSGQRRTLPKSSWIPLGRRSKAQGLREINSPFPVT